MRKPSRGEYIASGTLIALAAGYLALSPGDTYWEGLDSCIGIDMCWATDQSGRSFEPAVSKSCTLLNLESGDEIPMFIEANRPSVSIDDECNIHGTPGLRVHWRLQECADRDFDDDGDFDLRDWSMWIP